MCWEIEYKGELMDTLVQLKRAIGAENIILTKGCFLAALQDDSCLCPIDESATARKIGCEAELDYASNVIYFKEAL